MGTEPLRESGFPSPRIRSGDEALRPTRAEIDLDAVRHNLSVIRDVAGAARVLAVVKADAYGHGMVPVAQHLESVGVDGFGVALAEEGLELRAAGVTRDIVVLNGVVGHAHREVLEASLEPVVYSLAEVQAFQDAALGRPFGIHLKVDTGMARLGVPFDKLNIFLDGLDKFPRARVVGLMTHLACAESDDAMTREQLRRFGESLWRVRARGHRPRIVHSANSAALFRYPEARGTQVRPGIALYGVTPGGSSTPERSPERRLRPAMRLRSEVISVRDVAVGSPIGYDAAFRCTRPSRIATVPVGYGDGLMFAASGRGHMLVRGIRCPIVGRISMDLTTLDITDVGAAVVGDEVVWLGAQGSAYIDAAEMAVASGTISYEVLTAVSRRVPRLYRGSNRL